MKTQTENPARVVARAVEYFSAINTYAGFDAHKKAESFLAQKQSEGFVGYQSTYGPYGFSVTYWPKPEVSA